MKILLDECITKHLKPLLSPHEIFTVRELGWSGIKNGKLLSLCAENNFDILLTIDKHLQYQQNLSKYSISIVILDSKSADISELNNFIQPFVNSIGNFEKHKAYILVK